MRDMPLGPAFSVLRNRTAVVEELRRLLPKMEGARKAAPIPFGLPAIDRYLPEGGLAGGALHEIVPEQDTLAIAFGFVVALLARFAPVRTFFFVIPAYGLRRYGRLYGHGLNALGLNPNRLILVETAQRQDTLWAIEEALHSRAPAAVVGVTDKLDLRLSQLLQHAATDAGLPLFLLRPAEILQSSAAATRWRIGALPAARDRFGLIAHARWRLMLERCRNGRAGEWMVEYDHVAHRFNLAAALADSAFPRDANQKSIQHAG
jgi:protein ImuA